MGNGEIVKLRKRMGLNQEQFAQLLGVHKLTVSRWERGEAKPSLLAQRQLNRLVNKKVKKC